MSWSRKDIISDIKKQEYDVDITLPYHELKRKYRHIRYHRTGMATGIWRRRNDPPPDTDSD